MNVPTNLLAGEAAELGERKMTQAEFERVLFIALTTATVGAFVGLVGAIIKGGRRD